MRPDVIVTDELTDADAVAVQKAVQSGVKVLASAHGDRVETLPLALRNAFERIVLLDEQIIGKIKFFYDENLNEIGRVAYD
jgi:stage III sporulation protein SpoIIIAA